MFSALKSSFSGGVDAKMPVAPPPNPNTGPSTGPSTATLVVDSRHTRHVIGGWELEGVSIAGQETCIIVPRAKVVFDIGRCPQRAVFQQTVLITHGHLDHIGGAHFHVTSRQLAGLPPSKLVVPEAYVDNLKQFVDVANSLQGSPPIDYMVLGLKVGQELQLASGFIVRPFPTIHPVASQGYLLYSVRKKLRADLVGKSQEEIKTLRLAGHDVQEVHQIPEIAFTGDTTAAFLQQPGLEDVLSARLLIMELTFLDESVSVEEARERGHMHIIDFAANAHLFDKIDTILLIHFSSRYKRHEILSHLNTWLPPALRARCVPWLNGFPE